MIRAGPALDPKFPLEPKAVAELLQKLVQRKFGAKANFAVTVTRRDELELYGDTAAVEWGTAMIAKLMEK